MRHELFSDPRVLPEFELKVIQAPQTITNNPTEYASWRETLSALEQKITRESFDVAIIGCGGYGLPLARELLKNFQMFFDKRDSVVDDREEMNRELLSIFNFYRNGRIVAQKWRCMLK